MVQEKMVNAFGSTVQAHKNEIQSLQMQYLALQALNECVKDEFRKSAEAVLAENVFYIQTDTRSGRVFSERDTFLLSDADYEQFLKLCTAENYRRGLTDEEGNYTDETNTDNQLLKLKDEIVQFAVDLLPDMPEKVTLKRATANGNHFSYKTWDGVFKLFMQLEI